MGRALVVSAVALATAACAGPPPPPEFKGILATGTVAEARTAVPFRVRQPAYAPEGAKLAAVEWSTQMGAPFVVQRYSMATGQGFYILAIQPSEEFDTPPIDNEMLIQGRMATLMAIREDDRLLEWRLFWRVGGVYHLVAGDVAADEMVRIASSLR